jgi:ribosomal protein L16 Arg81 hydroxylase
MMSASDLIGPLNIEKILSPLSVEEFTNDYMGKRAVHLPGNAEDVAHLIDKDGVLELCKNPKADVFAGKIDERGAFHQMQIDNPNARHLYACGWSLQVEELHFLKKEFMALANYIRAELGVYSAMEAGVMLASAGKGYPFHFDPNPDVWIFQIFGAKKWFYVEEPAIDRPLEYSILPRGDRNPLSSSPHYELGRPNLEDKKEIILEPGDVFYFPGGTWHAAEAQEECCHVIIASVNSAWTDVFFDLLKDKLLDRPAWRQIPEDNETRKQHLSEVSENRLADLKAAVDSLTIDEIAAALRAGRKKRDKGAYRQQ